MDGDLKRDIEMARLSLPWMNIEKPLTPDRFRTLLTQLTSRDLTSMSVDDAFSTRPRVRIPPWLVRRLTTMPSVGDWALEVYEDWARDADVGGVVLTTADEQRVRDDREALRLAWGRGLSATSTSEPTELDATQPYTELDAPQPYTELDAPQHYTELDAPQHYTELDAPQHYTELDATQPYTELHATLPYTDRAASGSALAGFWIGRVLNSGDRTVPSLTSEEPQAVREYRLKGRLGGGGMGVVYLAAAPDGSEVCIKVMKSSATSSGDSRRRFRREIELLQRGVARLRLVDSDVDSDPPWFAYTYVPGVSLGDALREYGVVDSRSLLVLASDLFNALTDLHAEGLVHRDLKPANLILGRDGLRLIDFGIGKDLESSKPPITLDGQVLGTAGFMSPEQVLGSAVDAKCDVYGAAMVLAYSVIGSRIHWDERSQGRQLVDIVTRAPNVAPLPPWFTGLFLDCFKRDPADRPSASLVADRVDTELCRK